MQVQFVVRAWLPSMPCPLPLPPQAVRNKHLLRAKCVWPFGWRETVARTFLLAGYAAMQHLPVGAGLNLNPAGALRSSAFVPRSCIRDPRLAFTDLCVGAIPPGDKNLLSQAKTDCNTFFYIK